MTTRMLLSPSAALDLLVPLFARGRGGVTVETRDLSGVGHESIPVRTGTTDAPLHLLELVAEGWEIRSPVVSRLAHGGPPADLLAAFVAWKPAAIFNATSDWRHGIAPEAQAQITEALKASPLPLSVLVDGGPAVLALWLLHPVHRLDDGGLTPAKKLLLGMAETLGGDLESARGLDTVTVPIAGPIRNWSFNPPDPIQVFEITPGRTFTVNELTTAFARKESPRDNR